MPETYSTQAIVLQRRFATEADNRISLYTLDKGRISLIVKGDRRLASKLTPHLEPLTLLEVMVVSGRQTYAGGAVIRNCYPSIKADFDKMAAAGYALRSFNFLVKEDVCDENLFYLLSEFLALLDHIEAEAEWYRWLANLFLFNLIGHLGYGFKIDFSLGKEDAGFLDHLASLPLSEAVKEKIPRPRLKRLNAVLEKWARYNTEK